MNVVAWIARAGLLALFLVLLSASHPAESAPAAPLDSPGDWPMYGHDPQHTGYNAAEATISAANVADLALRWRYKVGNSGAPSSSSPSVAGGVVYVGSSASTGDNFFALDAGSGQPVWSADLHFQSTCLPVGIGSTAAISGTMVVVGGGDGAYYGLDRATGAKVWRHDFGAGPSQFAWVSPLLAHGRAYVGIASQCDNPSVRGEMRALDLPTGETVATQPLVPEDQRGAGIWNSPALSPDGGQVVITTGEDYENYDGPYTRALLSLDALSLAPLQADRQGDEDVDDDWANSPVIFSDSEGRTLVAASSKNRVLYAYELANIAAGPVWQRAAGFSVGAMAAYDPDLGAGGTLFVTADGQLFGLDPATGRDRWPPLPVGQVYAPIALANGLAFVNSGGSLYIIDGARGSVLRVITPPGGCVIYSGPVVANGIVYWQSGAFLYAYGLPDASTPATPTPVDPTECPLAFNDVSAGDYFAAAVRYLACNGAVSGYADGSFRPYSPTTRGQLAKMVALAYHYSLSAPADASFADVAAGSAFYPYVEAIAARGLVSGYCDGTFHPEAGVTRGQTAKILVLAAGLPTLPQGQTFGDVPPDNPFFAAINTAQHYGLISGYADGTFRPDAGATRGQISKILYGAINVAPLTK